MSKEWRVRASKEHGKVGCIDEMMSCCKETAGWHFGVFSGGADADGQRAIHQQSFGNGTVPIYVEFCWHS